MKRVAGDSLLKAMDVVFHVLEVGLDDLSQILSFGLFSFWAGPDWWCWLGSFGIAWQHCRR